MFVSLKDKKVEQNAVNNFFHLSKHTCWEIAFHPNKIKIYDEKVLKKQSDQGIQRIDV